jgi:hypothetical protein
MDSFKKKNLEVWFVYHYTDLLELIYFFIFLSFNAADYPFLIFTSISPTGEFLQDLNVADNFFSIKIKPVTFLDEHFFQFLTQKYFRIAEKCCTY